ARAGVYAEPDLHQWLHIEAGVVEWAGADLEVEVVRCGDAWSEELDVQAQVGVALEEFAKQRREHGAREWAGDAEAQCSAWSREQCADGEVGLLGLFEHALATVEVKLAGVGERDTAGCAFDEA